MYNFTRTLVKLGVVPAMNPKYMYLVELSPVIFTPFVAVPSRSGEK